MDSLDNSQELESGDNSEELELKTITLQEYKKIMQLIPQVENYKQIVLKLKEKLQSKDSQLKQLETALQNDWINVATLSIVSVLNIFYKFSPI